MMSNKSPSRRNFLKGVVFNTAALSVIPSGVIASNSFSPDPVRKDKSPRLPLKIYLNTRAGYFYRDPVGDKVREKIMKISPEISMVDDEQAIGEVNAWLGPINSEQFKMAPNLAWVHSTSA